MKNIRKSLKIFCGYLLCLMIVSSCWIGIEYIIENAVHSSSVDLMFAAFLSYFITDKYIDRFIDEE